MSSSPSSSPDSSPISKRKYHAASTFYLFCKLFVEDCAGSGRKFRTENQGMEAAALRWNSMTEEEHASWHTFLKGERKSATTSEMRKYKIRNGSRRDGDYDPYNLAKLKKLSLKDEQDQKALEQRWNWSFCENVIGVASERFLIVNVEVPPSTTNPGAFKTLTIVEFSLSQGIIDEYHAEIQNDSRHAEEARYAAINRVLEWPSKSGLSLGQATPVFFTPSSQLEAVYNSLTYVGESSKSDWNELEKTFSLSRDLAKIETLIRALRKWFGIEDGGAEGTLASVDGDDTCSLSKTRQLVNNILIGIPF